MCADNCHHHSPCRRASGIYHGLPRKHTHTHTNPPGKTVMGGKAYQESTSPSQHTASCRMTELSWICLLVTLPRLKQNAVKAGLKELRAQLQQFRLNAALRG